MALPLHFDIPTVPRPSDSTVMVDAVTLQSHGTLDKVVFKQAPLPTDLSEDYVEVEVDHCGINFMDNYLRLGIVRQGRFPIVLGSECAGEVKRIGSKVTKFKAGQTVLCLKMHGGLFRRTVQLPQANCFPVPEGVAPVDAVGLGLDFLTAYVCLFEIGGLREGQSVFMQSIGGGVGTSVVQLARTVPGVNILGSASDFKHGHLLELGVHHVFGHDEKCKERILEACPEGVDIVINTNGGTDTDECLELLKPFGKLVLIGSNSTVIYPKANTWGFVKPVWDVRDVPTSQLIGSNYCITGVNIGKFIETSSQRSAAILAEIFDLYKREKIKPVFDSVLPLEKISVAFAQICTRTNLGKVVVMVKRPAKGQDSPPQDPGTSRQPSSRLEKALSGRSSRKQPEAELGGANDGASSKTPKVGEPVGEAEATAAENTAVPEAELQEKKESTCAASGAADAEGQDNNLESAGEISGTASKAEPPAKNEDSNGETSSGIAISNGDSNSAASSLSNKKEKFEDAVEELV